MSVFDYFNKKPLTSDEVRELKGFDFKREFFCSKCRARLSIRSRDERDDGPSNFSHFPYPHKLAGHATLPAHLLNWKGLVEERGWKVEPVVCPACQKGVSVREFRLGKAFNRG